MLNFFPKIFCSIYHPLTGNQISCFSHLGNNFFPHLRFAGQGFTKIFCCFKPLRNNKIYKKKHLLYNVFNFSLSCYKSETLQLLYFIRCYNLHIYKTLLPQIPTSETNMVLLHFSQSCCTGVCPPSPQPYHADRTTDAIESLFTRPGP